MDQTARKIAVAKFRKGDCRVLVVTDVAARGIGIIFSTFLLFASSLHVYSKLPAADLPLLDNVINYHSAGSARAFVHRCGRTARAGRKGCAYSLITLDDVCLLELFARMNPHLFELIRFTVALYA